MRALAQRPSDCRRGGYGHGEHGAWLSGSDAEFVADYFVHYDGNIFASGAILVSFPTSLTGFFEPLPGEISIAGASLVAGFTGGVVAIVSARLLAGHLFHLLLTYAALWLVPWILRDESARTMGVLGTATVVAILIARSVAWTPVRRLRPSILLTATGVVLPVLVAVFARGPAGVSERNVDQAARERPNVILIVIDTVRRDRTSLAEGTFETTPHLQRLAHATASPVTEFTHASAPASSTVPSVKALFTSQPPSHWGFAQAGSEPPPSDSVTMARTFRDSGYETAAISANALIRGAGFESGFAHFWSAGGLDHFQSSFLLFDMLSRGRKIEAMRRVADLGVHKVGGETVFHLAGQWVENRSGGRPFFLYLHIIEPHWPYRERGYDLVPEDLRDLPNTWSYLDLLPLVKGSGENSALRGTKQLRELVGRYDEELRHADHLTGRFVSDLDRKGLRKDTMLIITADHGEEFFDHNGFSHGHDVFEEQIHVPLVIRWPSERRFGRYPRKVETPVSLVDLMPTLVDMLELRAPATSLVGASWRPLLELGKSHRHPTTSEGYLGPSVRGAYRDGRFKIRIAFDPAISPLESDRVFAFDLEADPLEMDPLPLGGPAVEDLVIRARSAFAQRWMRGPGREQREGGHTDDETRTLEQLRALGYLD